MKRKRNLWLDCLHIVVLCNFAVAQPLFDRLSRKLSYVQSHGIEVPAIVTFAVILAVIVPLPIVLLELALGAWSEKARERVHAGALFVLLAMVLLPFLRLLRVGPIEGMSQVALSLVLAGLGVFAYLRFDVARLLVTAGTPAIVVFPLMFLFHSPIRTMLFPQPNPKTAPLGVTNPVPIVMVVFDEFNGTSLMNAEHKIDAERYPHFAALARDATWFRNASSVHPRTDSAVPAILTGLYPPPPFVKPRFPKPPNLFTLIEATNQYRMIAFEPYTQLYPMDIDREPPPQLSYWGQMRPLFRPMPQVFLRNLLPPDLPFEPPDIPRDWFGIQLDRLITADKATGLFRHGWGTERARQFEEFLRRIDGAEQPALYFSHVVLPHFPWCYLPSGRRYEADQGSQWDHSAAGGENFEEWDNDELAVARGYQRYLLQLGYTDHLIGKLVATLKEHDLYDESLIIVMADHGVSFRPGLSRRLPVPESLPDILSVPLFVKRPGQREGSISDRNVESIDVLPTILEILGTDRTIAMDGRSLFNPSRPERAKKTMVHAEDKFEMDAAFESKYRTLEHRRRMFPHETEPDGLFRIGPHKELIGRRVDELEITQSPHVQVKLANQQTQRYNYSTDPEAVVPSYVKGQVRVPPGTPMPLSLAIAVNGTIRAVTQTYRSETAPTLWSAMVPETSFELGDNSVQVFIISQKDGRVVLERPFDPASAS